MLKKIIKINIILIVSIWLLFEIVFYFKSVKAENLNIHDIPFINIPRNAAFDFTSETDDSGRIRNFYPQNLNKTNYPPPIVIGGGSFAYSFGLTQEDSLANLLSKYSNRPVFVRAYCACGPNELLWSLKQDKFYEFIPQEPEFLMYLFIENHFSRMFSKIYSLQSPKIRPIYTFDENYNAKEKPCYYKFLFLSHIFKYIYREKVTLNYGIVDEEQLLKTLKAMQQEMNRHWKNTKLIFLRYSEPNNDKPYLFSNNFINKCKENNIIYLDADDITFDNSGKRLTGDIYMQQDQHPSALAYKLLAPKLAQKINKL